MLAVNLITGETPVSLQAALAVAAALWGAAWWISNVLRRIDKRFSRFENRQQRQWKVIVLMLRHIFKDEEIVNALLVENDEGVSDTTKK